VVTTQQLESIKQKHGSYASWAVWADASERPKSNIGDISHFENETDLSLLKHDVVMVGLNVSMWDSDSKPFQNFHSPKSSANDFKIRYAFKDSPYYGAYMTDIIKLHKEVEAKQVVRYLKEHPDIIEKNLKTFRDEMRDLIAVAPIILAFGGTTHKLLSDNLNRTEYSKLIKLTHYSHYIRKEDYKERVFREIESQ
jgi:hypothetical protein